MILNSTVALSWGSEGCEGDILLNGGVELGRKVV